MFCLTQPIVSHTCHLSAHCCAHAYSLEPDDVHHTPSIYFTRSNYHATFPIGVLNHPFLRYTPCPLHSLTLASASNFGRMCPSSRLGPHLHSTIGTACAHISSHLDAQSPLYHVCTPATLSQGKHAHHAKVVKR
jgi:hypothetical protein